MRHGLAETKRKGSRISERVKEYSTTRFDIGGERLRIADSVRSQESGLWAPDSVQVSGGHEKGHILHLLFIFPTYDCTVCCDVFLYNDINKSVLVESRPLVKFTRNYIWDSSGVFSISSLVRISMTSFSALTLSYSLTLVQRYSSLYNRKNITWWLEYINFIFSWYKTIFYHSK